MRTTRSIQECIKDPARTAEITDFIARGRSERMQTFDQHLLDLCAPTRSRSRRRSPPPRIPTDFQTRLALEGAVDVERSPMEEQADRTVRDRAGRAVLGRAERRPRRWTARRSKRRARTWTFRALLRSDRERGSRASRTAPCSLFARDGDARGSRCALRAAAGFASPEVARAAASALAEALEDVAASRETQRVAPLAAFGTRGAGGITLVALVGAERVHGRASRSRRRVPLAGRPLEVARSSPRGDRGAPRSRARSRSRTRRSRSRSPQIERVARRARATRC